tara:strand:+ start:2093 stop:2689 length:597 start_codon:yes stop_codon:yes gene_type:complete
MNFRWLPNILTSIRVLLVPIFLYCLFTEYDHGKFIALITFLVAAITDAYDGIIARKYNLVSKFGIFFDPLADKILILSAFYAFMFIPILSPMVKLWMVILISFRDVVITILRTILQYKGITMITSKLGKLKTALQLITINVILIFLILNSYKVGMPYIWNEIKFLYILMLITTIITFYTGLHYLLYNYKTLEKLIYNK